MFRLYNFLGHKFNKMFLILTKFQYVFMIVIAPYIAFYLFINFLKNFNFYCSFYLRFEKHVIFFNIGSSTMRQT